MPTVPEEEEEEEEEEVSELHGAFSMRIFALVGLPLIAFFFAEAYVCESESGYPTARRPKKAAFAPGEQDPSPFSVEDIKPAYLIFACELLAVVGWRVLSHPGGKWSGLGAVGIWGLRGFMGVIWGAEDVVYAVGRGLGFDVGSG